MSPAPLREVKPEYLPAYLSNGLVGLRVGPIPLIDGLSIVSGLRAADPEERVESFARGPYPLAGDIIINGHALSRHADRRRLVEQRYDFSCGELTSTFEYCVDGIRALAQVLSLCNRSLPTIVQQEVAVRVDGACELSIVSGLSCAGLGGRLLHRETTEPSDGQPFGDGVFRRRAGAHPP